MYVLMYICIILVELVEKCTIGGKGRRITTVNYALIYIKNCVYAYVVRLRGLAELERRFCITFYVKFYSR